MGKLGKKARKFAKKNLPALLKQRRKNKAFFKKKSPSNKQSNIEEDEVDNKVQLNTKRNTDFQDIGDTSLDIIFAEYESDEDNYSESDGYLSEEINVPDENEHISEDDEDEIKLSTLSIQNKKIQKDLIVQKKKLDKLKKKDPNFSKYLENYKGETSENDEMESDEDETTNEKDDFTPQVYTASIITSLREKVEKEQSGPALTSLVNAYRSACHFGIESSPYTIQNSETFSNIIMFMLSEADNIFRKFLQISPSNTKKENISALKDTPKWKSLEPIIKSYLRSSLYLLNQGTDLNILTYCLTRIRVSLLFFARFPSLLGRLIKISVNLWATGGGNLSSASFLIIKDVASLSSSDCFESCLAKSFIAYNLQCKVPELVNIDHINFLRDSILELCSIDVFKSSEKALASIRQLVKILQWGLLTKKREAIKQICSWEYINCIDVWVSFISSNINQYDLNHSFVTLILLINGLAYIFPGPRYFPLRLKCIQWLNKLSISSKTFIPIASFMLDTLEYKFVKDNGISTPAFNFTTVLKLPKPCLKYRGFEEECIKSSIEELCVHFDQWCFHISFPELATIPLIRLRKFHETTTFEGLKRLVKRFIDQVEQNVDFVQKKREEVAFSPNDHEAADSFLQFEKSSFNAPFTQYYRSILEKSAKRKLEKNDKLSVIQASNDHQMIES